jgi:hypothetical protein
MALVGHHHFYRKFPKVLTPWLPPGTYRAMTAGKAEQPKRIGGSNQLVSAHEAAAYLGVSYARFIQHYSEWGLTPVRLDTRLRFRQRDIDALVESRMT